VPKNFATDIFTAAKKIEKLITNFTNIDLFSAKTAEPNSAKLTLNYTLDLGLA